jgi:hypothetical protein
MHARRRASTISNFLIISSLIDKEVIIALKRGELGTAANGSTRSSRKVGKPQRRMATEACHQPYSIERTLIAAVEPAGASRKPGHGASRAPAPAMKAWITAVLRARSHDKRDVFWTRSAGRLRLPSQGVERRLLLVVERRIEVIKHRLQRLRCIEHRGQPIVHRIETADRGLRGHLRAR